MAWGIKMARTSRRRLLGSALSASLFFAYLVAEVICRIDASLQRQVSNCDLPQLHLPSICREKIEKSVCLMGAWGICHYAIIGPLER